MNDTKIEVGDIVRTRFGSVQAVVLSISNHQGVRLQYPLSIQKQPLSNLILIRKQKMKNIEKLYTMNSGTQHFRILSEHGEYCWVKDTQGLLCPLTCHRRNLHEVPVYEYLVCSIEGCDIPAYKKAFKTSFIKKGDSFVTKHGNVLTVKSVSDQPHERFPKIVADADKIPMLEGRRIKFI